MGASLLALSKSIYIKVAVVKLKFKTVSQFRMNTPKMFSGSVQLVKMFRQILQHAENSSGIVGT